MELTVQIPPLHRKSCRSPLHLSFEKTKIAAVTAAAQRFCARKAKLAQSAIGHVIHIAKQRTQLRTAVFLARRVPETLGNRRGKVRFVVFLCALPQVGGTHDFEKTIAVNPIKSRHRMCVKVSSAGSSVCSTLYSAMRGRMVCTSVFIWFLDLFAAVLINLSSIFSCRENSEPPLLPPKVCIRNTLICFCCLLCIIPSSLCFYGIPVSIHS